MIQIREKGLQDYTTIWEEMVSFTNSRNADTPDEIWLLEHYSVFTQGLTGRSENLLEETDISVIQSDRGGQITYHAPGQLIVYCLIDIKRLLKIFTFCKKTIPQNQPISKSYRLLGYSQ